MGNKNCGYLNEIGFFKPRVLVYTIDSIQGCKNKTFLSRDVLKTKDWLSSGKNVVVLQKRYQGYNQEKTYKALINDPDFLVMLENKSFIIFSTNAEN